MVPSFTGAPGPEKEIIRDSYLIVAIAGDLNARLFHLHVNNQAFHHRQSVLVVTEVL